MARNCPPIQQQYSIAPAACVWCHTGLICIPSTARLLVCLVVVAVVRGSFALVFFTSLRPPAPSTANAASSVVPSAVPSAATAAATAAATVAVATAAAIVAAAAATRTAAVTRTAAATRTTTSTAAASHIY